MRPHRRPLNLQPRGWVRGNHSSSRRSGFAQPLPLLLWDFISLPFRCPILPTIVCVVLTERLVRYRRARPPAGTHTIAALPFALVHIGSSGVTAIDLMHSQLAQVTIHLHFIINESLRKHCIHVEALLLPLITRLFR
jgi:hypothetical protein